MSSNQSDLKENICTNQKKRRKWRSLSSFMAKNAARSKEARETPEQRRARLEYTKIMTRKRRAREKNGEKETRLAVLRENSRSYYRGLRIQKERQKIANSSNLTPISQQSHVTDPSEMGLTSTNLKKEIKHCDDRTNIPGNSSLKESRNSSLKLIVLNNCAGNVQNLMQGVLEKESESKHRVEPNRRTRNFKKSAKDQSNVEN